MSDEGMAFSHRLVVRFSDCDMMGHVNHAVYFTYFEQCRLAWWRHLGSEGGLPGASAAVVAHAECDYRAPAFVDEELEIRLSLGGIGQSSVTIAYVIVNATTGVLVAEGKTVSVNVDPVTQKTRALPESTRRVLERGSVK